MLHEQHILNIEYESHSTEINTNPKVLSYFFIAHNVDLPITGVVQRQHIGTERVSLVLSARRRAEARLDLVQEGEQLTTSSHLKDLTTLLLILHQIRKKDNLGTTYSPNSKDWTT